MADLWKIAGGTVYDPANGIHGTVRDVWLDGGKIVAAPSQTTAHRTLDARGLVVMPAGLDMHCHLVGSKVNAGRKLRPEEARRGPVWQRTPRTYSGNLSSVPTTLASGYGYAALGYGTAFDAAIAPLGARHAHEEFADTPCLDKGCYLLVGNNHYVLDSLKARDPQQLQAFLGWLLEHCKGYACKIVNAGGIEQWKQHRGATLETIDQPVDYWDVTPRQILRGIAQAIDELQLPHAVHIHCNHLGHPGNWRTTLQTMEALEGFRGHLTHIQYHSYGGGPDDPEPTFHSQVLPLVEYVNTHPNLSVDVGQVMFGDTTSMTGDGPLGHYLYQIYGSKWLSSDTELESGCGIVPLRYRQRDYIHAMQWAVGLEWYLLMQDPWRVVMSTDHPNGGTFLSYPRMIRLLMDREFRRETLAAVHPKVREHSQLADLTREYSLSEICIITRAGPARLLGLTNKGHLGVGADADLTLYTPQHDYEQMFQVPRYVIKEGILLAEQGELRNVTSGRTWYVEPEYDRERAGSFEKWWNEHATIQFKQYEIDADELERPAPVKCGP